MKKYINREVEVINGIAKVIKEGTELNGKFFFRKKEYQDVFDELRNQQYVNDFWKDHNGKFHFLFLSGEEKVYSREDIKRMANENEY